tara:strand:+ start:2494 stop:2673 length:180 start_codon:yes stop_codon:yes gene_type:complete
MGYPNKKQNSAGKTGNTSHINEVLVEKVKSTLSGIDTTKPSFTKRLGLVDNILSRPSSN